MVTLVAGFQGAKKLYWPTVPWVLPALSTARTNRVWAPHWAALSTIGTSPVALPPVVGTALTAAAPLAGMLASSEYSKRSMPLLTQLPRVQPVGVGSLEVTVILTPVSPAWPVGALSPPSGGKTGESVKDGMLGALRSVLK